MITIPVILMILVCLGITKSNNENLCLAKENTNAIKGLFILLVFYNHIIPYLTNAGVIFSPVLDIPSNQLINRRLGQLMVVMFLFYSGYGVTESIRTKGNKYIGSIPFKRVLSTLVNYDIAIIAFLILNVVLSIHYPIRQYLLSLVAWKSVGQSEWYIFTILLCYVVTYVTFSLFENKQKALLSTILLFLVYIIVMHRFKQDHWYNTILAYPAGMTVSLYKKNIFSLLDKHYWICLSFLTIVFVILYHFRSITYVYILTSVSFAYFVFAITYKLIINNRILEWCGKNLFQLYIYQRIPMILLVTLFPDMVRLHPYVYVSCCLAVTILFAFAVKPVKINFPNS